MPTTTDATQNLYARLLPIFQEVHLLAEGMEKHTNRERASGQTLGRLLSWCRDSLLEAHQVLADEESAGDLPGDLQDWLTFDLPVLDLALMRAAEAPADPFPVRLHVNRVGAVVPSLVYFADMARVYCQQRVPAGAEQAGEVLTVRTREEGDTAPDTMSIIMEHLREALAELDIMIASEKAEASDV